MNNSLFAQSDHYLIKHTLNNYIEGTSYNRTEQIKHAFHPKSNLFLSPRKQDKDLWIVPSTEYANWYNKNKDTFNGRYGHITNIQIEDDVATAKVNITIPEYELIYTDLFLLRKIASKWKIISKTAASKKSNATGERILFVVSNAQFHGTSTKPAGSSFSEIIKAYDTFVKAGYIVDFVSPQGGAITLAYINTSNTLHKQYLYNSDFMYAIKHTKQPTEIISKNYKAIHYIGGSSAIYGVPENVQIQKIAMDIYEKHHGIISSVCHGTAGIVNLKTKDGQYLVNNKQISGYPEAYENQNAEYFKQFPFLIQRTIEDRKGIFKTSAKGEPHVEVDGRIITGQNHLSSVLVAQEIINLLKNKT
ncbi:nuclear transport factor 2 family protein [Pseudoalteromonas denitrificans]|nr:nuclear transport factor 2 family protein [Pseudoalteromonas denitrificans]